jgi:hypothetical protein
MKKTDSFSTNMVYSGGMLHMSFTKLPAGRPPARTLQRIWQKVVPWPAMLQRNNHDATGGIWRYYQLTLVGDATIQWVCDAASFG